MLPNIPNLMVMRPTQWHINYSEVSSSFGQCSQNGDVKLFALYWK